ncbi:hypothetical protein CU041_11510 [Thalassospira povalilytica]|uniref:Transmembrane protein n=1 Tax=Thalassospira povalilytica TaxID=732237 RepID=A0ABX4R6K0_9PROT|nr:hypothetical protein CU041_11510 [Thalassospira povalilytica]
MLFCRWLEELAPPIFPIFIIRRKFWFNVWIVRVDWFCLTGFFPLWLDLTFDSLGSDCWPCACLAFVVVVRIGVAHRALLQMVWGVDGGGDTM